MSYKLSIITINFNDAEGLRRTFRSVGNQSCQDFEYVVVDGASRDDSLSVIQNAECHISSWISEPDTGIYNAMNKGIRLATGEYLLFLNSGDWFYEENVIERVLPYLGGKDFYSGGCMRGDWHRPAPAAMSLHQISYYPLEHQATFIRRAMLVRRPYDESMRIVSDWEQMFYELVVNGATYEALPFTIANFDVTGVSSTNQLPLEKEYYGVWEKYFSREMLNKGILQKGGRLYSMTYHMLEPYHPLKTPACILMYYVIRYFKDLCSLKFLL